MSKIPQSYTAIIELEGPSTSLLIGGVNALHSTPMHLADATAWVAAIMDNEVPLDNRSFIVRFKKRLVPRDAADGEYLYCDFAEDQRVELSPGTDQWMMGDRCGTVVRLKDGSVRVKMDVSGKVLSVKPEHIGKIIR